MSWAESWQTFGSAICSIPKKLECDGASGYRLGLHGSAEGVAGAIGQTQGNSGNRLRNGHPSTGQSAVCGPVEIRVEGFAPVYGEVLFLDMQPTDGIYEPRLGYIVLEQCQAAVDMLGLCLVHLKKTDLK